MNFENSIKEWIELDNELKKLNETTKLLREKKKALEEILFKTHKLQEQNNGNIIKINDSLLKFCETKTTEPLTFKYLENSLQSLIKNENQIKTILEHIKQSRAVKTIPEIKRLYIKKTDVSL